MIFLKSIPKKNKIIVLALMAIIIAACIIRFTIPAQAKTDDVVYGMFEPGQGKALNKDELKTTHLKSVLQEQIDSMDEVSNSLVTIDTQTGNGQPIVSVAVNLSFGKKLTLEQQASIKALIKNTVQDVSEDNIHLSISDNASAQ